MSNPKEHAHVLLDMLPEEKLTAVVGLLEVWWNRCCVRWLPLR
ncbi:MAG: hypothetical protein ACLQVL_25660 [Terriglobia bacterium]